MEPVTHAENGRRGIQRNSKKTHCPRPQEHPYDEENTIRTKRGWRECRICKREQS